MFDVSIIIATYNPDYTQLVNTINSILNQKDLRFEILIADDGSENNYFSEIEEYFYLKGFVNFQLIEHSRNVGTCLNIFDALKKASGYYVKTISPGDYLFSNETMSKWVDFMNDNCSDISFGNIVNYHCENENCVVDEVLIRPRLREFYKKKNKSIAKLNYLVLGDAPNGAGFLIKTNVLHKYLSMIINKVKYAEDFSVRLMLLDDIELQWYDCNVVWYEYGTGISTSNNSKWKALLDKDLMSVNGIISDNKDTYKGINYIIGLYICVCNILGKYSSKLKYIFFPYLFYYGYKRNRCSLVTDIDIDVHILTDVITHSGKVD